jgi:uncharacterized protein
MSVNLKLLLSALGCACLVLGAIGIFLPILPTTPFVLLAAWCFSRSSEQFHNWLINHKQLGTIIKAWQSESGIPPQACYKAIAMTWLGLSLSMLIIAKLWAVVLLCSIGLVLSLYLLRMRKPQTE